MNKVAELEQQVLGLSPRDRERLAVTVWESLEGVSAVDPEGIEIAQRRDAEVESGSARVLSHSEFMRRTNDSG